MRLMIDRQFLLAVQFIFPFPSLVPHRAELFMTSISTMLHRQPLLWRYILLVHSILLKNKELKREEDITGLLKVIVTEFYLMEWWASREPFYFSMTVLSSTRSPTTVNTCAVTALQLILTPLFITVDIFALVVPLISSYVCCLLHSSLTMMTAYARSMLQWRL